LKLRNGGIGKNSFDVTRRSFARVVVTFDEDINDNISWEFVVTNSENRLITKVNNMKKGEKAKRLVSRSVV